MRKIATVKNDNPIIKRIMIYDKGYGAYVFLFDSLEDGPAVADEWYESLSEAEAGCEIEYGININDWTYIDDPLEDCQHDWIAPVRLKGRGIGKPEWGNFERLENGVWKKLLNK